MAESSPPAAARTYTSPAAPDATRPLTRFTTPDLFVVAPHVWGLRDTFVNLYFIRPDDVSLAWVLVDCGVPGSAHKVREAAAQLFGADVPPTAIILTHGHFDHTGTISDAFPEVPVYAHPLELPYLTGLSSYPPPDPGVGGGAMAWLSFLYPKAPLNLGERVRALTPDGTVPDLPGWRWLPSPGHTAGHISLFREADRTLVAGDAFTTVKGESAWHTLLQDPEVHGPPAYFTPDWDSARDSVRRLAALEPETVATGHGLPLRGATLRRDLDALARDFDTVARPARGRYIHEPALADEEGVVSVPPSLGLAGLPRVAYVAAGALLGFVAVLTLTGNTAQSSLSKKNKKRDKKQKKSRAGKSATRLGDRPDGPVPHAGYSATSDEFPEHGAGGMAVSSGRGAAGR